MRFGTMTMMKVGFYSDEIAGACLSAMMDSAVMCDNCAFLRGGGNFKQFPVPRSPFPVPHSSNRRFGPQCLGGGFAL